MMASYIGLGLLIGEGGRYDHVCGWGVQLGAKGGEGEESGVQVRVQDILYVGGWVVGAGRLGGWVTGGSDG